jgi:hypothetical protein
VSVRAAAFGILLALAACAPAPLDLPAEPVQRASTCTAVRALETGTAGAGSDAASFAAFTSLLHIGMIEAARRPEGVDSRRLMEIGRQAPIRMEELREANWQSLIEPCRVAYPENHRPAPPLPEAPFDAALTCFGIADLIAQAAQGHEPERRELAGLANRALASVTAELRSRAGRGEDIARLSQSFARAGILGGSPPSLIEQCERRFPARARP